MTRHVRRLTTVLTFTMYVMVNVVAVVVHHHHHHDDKNVSATAFTVESRHLPGLWDGDDDGDGDGCCSLCVVVHSAQDVATPFRASVPAALSGFALPTLFHFTSHPFPRASRSRAPPLT